MYGLRVLSVGEWCACDLSDSALSILSNILSNNAHTLESLTMPYLDSRIFPAILCPHVHTLRVDDLSTTAKELARAFPHLRSLEVKTVVSSFIQSQSTLWPSLTNVTGSLWVIRALARHHALRRVTIRRSQYLVLSVHWLGPKDFRIVFSDAIFDCLLETLSLDLRVSALWEQGDFSSPLLSRLASSAPNLKYLAFCLFTTPKISEGLQMMISPHIHALGNLRSLRYVALSMCSAVEFLCKYTGAFSPEQERDAIVRHWFAMIPSLEYLELEVKISEWPVTWWRRTDDHLREESDGAGGVTAMVQISKEEGKAARERYWQ
ncbi:hypothetical protein EW146_g8870 [Bondarzewia mesenterica]|uniref:F-box domain-containing protein n=1 Tax=Bondarzewia mesenterica TaxID=1095465 RepID=A0A4S4LCC7_9AGAM|nr:hypothetical protein EW146_g8870 [Bondarzewia mesenterica]